MSLNSSNQFASKESTFNSFSYDNIRNLIKSTTKFNKMYNFSADFLVAMPLFIAAALHLQEEQLN